MLCTALQGKITLRITTCTVVVATQMCSKSHETAADNMECVQAYAKPPALVELTLSGVMTVLQKTPTWDEAKKQLGDASFMEKLLKFDKDKLNDALLKKLQKFTTNLEFTPEVTCPLSSVKQLRCSSALRKIEVVAPPMSTWH